MYALCAIQSGGRGCAGGENFCAGVRAKLFWLSIYCAKPKLDPGSQSGSWYLRGMGRRAPWIIQEYGFVTTIAIRPSTQPGTRERGYSSFAIISQLKFARTARSSFPIMTSTDRTNREKCFPLSLQCLLCLSLFYFSHKSRSFPISSFM